MGVSAGDMIQTLKALGDVSAGLNVPLERLALNYGQVLTQGKLTGKELKDFTTAGVPLLDELSKNLGKSKTEIQDMVSQGKISAQDMVDAFQSMTSEGGKFANLMEAQSKTLAGQWSNLQDTLAGIGEQIGLAIMPLLTDMVETAAEAGDNLNNMGEQGMTASEMISRGIAIVLN
jgi:tape measure domain-containing protein